MPTNPSSSSEGFKIYWADYLPGFSRPLVFTTWQQSNRLGLPVLRIEYLILFTAAVIQAEAANIDLRYLAGTENDVSATTETLLEIALERARDHLEQAASQTVVLDEVDADKLGIVAYREGWADKWQEILDRTQCGPLRRVLEAMEESPLRNLADFKPITPRRR